VSRRIRPGEGWQISLGELLTYLGWQWAHTREAYVPGRRAPITPMSGPGGKGFPDLTAWRPAGWRGEGRVLFAEAKAGSATPEPAQRARLVELDRAGVESYLFREVHAHAIEDVLGMADRPAPALEVVALLQPWRHPRSSSQAAAWGVERPAAGGTVPTP
jgi:hypothetical protein